MAAAGARIAMGRRFPDPLRATWRLLCNAKFAQLTVGLALIGSMAGVLIAQVPAPMRSNPAGRAAWLEGQRDNFGPFTDLMDRFDLFDVFRAPWYAGLWAVILVAVTVCTVSRFLPTHRSVQRPVRVVNDRYFELAHHRASFSHEGGEEAVAAGLRQRRYRVSTELTAPGVTYLFAERYAWAVYGTFISHLALLMVLAGGLLTIFAGFSRTLALAEGTSAAPVFDTPGPNQLFVKMLDAVRGIDERGNVVDFRSHLEVRRGGEFVRCTTTVNDACVAFGYKIHQAAFFDDIARLRVTGQAGVLFDDVVDFDDRKVAVPHLRVVDSSGATVVDQPLPQIAVDTGRDDTRADDVGIGRLTVPGAEERAYFVSWRIEGDRLLVAIVGADIPAPVALDEGQALRAGGSEITYAGPRLIPARRIDDLPGAAGPVTFQMPTDRDGKPYLVISGTIGDDPFIVLPEGQPGAAAGLTYEFRGRVEASGVEVRRDPGDTFIWVAVGLATVGLAMTFYVPRRRVWAKVTPDRTYLAGVAEKTSRFSRELRRLGASLGSKDALLPEDTEREA